MWTVPIVFKVNLYLVKSNVISYRNESGKCDFCTVCKIDKLSDPVRTVDG